MIRVLYDPETLTLHMEGHAGCGEPGQDIVCAAASMLAYTAGYLLIRANASGELLELRKTFEVGKVDLFAIPKERYARRLIRSFEDICAGFSLLARQEPCAVRVEKL